MRQGIEGDPYPGLAGGLSPISASCWKTWPRVAGRRISAANFEYRCRDGSTYWTEVFVYPVLDAAGRLQEIVGVSRDIAEHKRYALALQQVGEAADRANQALQAANAELQRSRPPTL